MYATMEEQWLILIKQTVRKIKFHHIKKVVANFTDVTDFDNEQIYICILTQTTTVNSMSNVHRVQMFLREK